MAKAAKKPSKLTKGKILAASKNEFYIDPMEVPAKLWEDREVALAMLAQHGKNYQYIPYPLGEDREIVLAAATQQAFYNDYNSIPSGWKYDKEIAIAWAFAQQGAGLDGFPAELKADREVAVAIVKERNVTFEELPILHDDWEMASLVTSRFPDLLKFTSQRLRNTPEFMRPLVEKDGYSLKFASNRLKDDPEMVALAITKTGKGEHRWTFIEHASPRLQRRYSKKMNKQIAANIPLVLFQGTSMKFDLTFTRWERFLNKISDTIHNLKGKCKCLRFSQM